jgi:8-oxo-dGTP pyrophosphatase MutT (NUDIX family)
MSKEKNTKTADKLNEIIRVIDKNGDWTGKYKTREYVHSHNLFYNNVSVWIINTTNKTILLEHRSINKLHNPDKWCPPGGHVAEDETLTQAAINEVKEEIGVKVSIDEIHFLCMTPPINNSMSFKYHFYILINKPFKTLKIQKEEVSEVRYVKYSDWKHLAKTNSKKVTAKWEKWEKAFTLMDSILRK